jgi:HPt (histidine-containing phosphotransfer) domain-containing protein
MSIDQVIEQFRPVFRAELPDRITRIHAGLKAHGADRSDGLQRAFREAHSLSGMAAYMDAPELTAAAERLSILARELLTLRDEVASSALTEAWRVYEVLRSAAAAYLGVVAVGPARPAADARSGDDR